MTNKTVNHLVSDINAEAGEFNLVCKDPDTGQSITFTEVDGRQVVTHSYQDAGNTKQVSLSDAEAAELIAWRNSGRRNSYWDWPGWAAVRMRNLKAFHLK